MMKLIVWCIVATSLVTVTNSFQCKAKLSTWTNVRVRGSMKMYLGGADPTQLHDLFHTHKDALLDASSWLLSEEAASVYTRIDKTGFIGSIASYIEVAIDLFSRMFNAAGIKNGYGPAIVLFTIFVRFLTVPLTAQQLGSTTVLQRMAPLQQKIQAKYANDEQTKNKLLAQLFQATGANPLAGCLPALVQIPVFISLYRALTNLVAERKLSESFLWIPSLEGPVFDKPPSESFHWLDSILSGQPLYGWSDTLAYLSLPILLYITQSVSQKFLQPARDPSRKMTEQEEFSQNLLVGLPVIAAVFCLNAPASLSVYWIVNSISATIATIVIKNNIKNEPFPAEVDRIMALVDGVGSKSEDSSNSESRTARSVVDDKPKPAGFSSSSSSSTFSATTASAAENASSNNSSETTENSKAAVSVGDDDNSKVVNNSRNNSNKKRKRN